jgi:hypothetical protein
MAKVVIHLHRPLPPCVVAAITEQAGRFIHAQANVYRHDLLERLASRLVDITASEAPTKVGNPRSGQGTGKYLERACRPLPHQLHPGASTVTLSAHDGRSI